MPALMMAAYVAVFSAELAGDRTFFALGSLALMTKAVLATTVGLALGQWLGQRTLRVASLAVYLVRATLAVVPAGQ